MVSKSKVDKIFSKNYYDVCWKDDIKTYSYFGEEKELWCSQLKPVYDGNVADTEQKKTLESVCLGKVVNASMNMGKLKVTLESGEQLIFGVEDDGET